MILVIWEKSGMFNFLHAKAWTPTKQSESTMKNLKPKVKKSPLPTPDVKPGCSTLKKGELRTTDHGSRTTDSGIALVAVLAILVVLAIMAASFTMLMNIESKQSAVQLNSQQLDMLVSSGLEQAKAILTIDELDKELDSSISAMLNGVPSFSKWMLIKNPEGKVYGRYRFRIEDESSKVNINKAFLLKNGKGTGWDTGEIVLPRALGVPRKSAQKLIDYRYGKNKIPGTRGDDDQNNLILMADGIDNNANGIIDEEDEGMDDPKEYSAEHLKGDDRKFSSMTELMSVMLEDNKKMSPKLRAGISRELPRRATIYSVDKPGSPTLPNDIPSDINCVTPRECRKLLIRANSDMPFEPNASKQQQLAANLVDYRDENHVLTTLGSTYGVEAICFNEILANDESGYFSLTYGTRPKSMCHDWEHFFPTTDGKRPQYTPTAAYCAVPALNWYTIDPRGAWHVKNDGGTKVGSLNVSGGTTKIGLPKAPGKNANGKLTNYRNGAMRSFGWKSPPDFPSAPSEARWLPGGFTHAAKRDDYEEFYEEMMDVLKKRGKASGNRPRLPKNIFKNSHAMVYTWGFSDESNTKGQPVGCYEVSSSSDHDIVISSRDIYTRKPISARLSELGMNATDDFDLSISFNAWGNGHLWAELPEVTSWSMLRSRQPIGGRYFNIVVNRQPSYPEWNAHKATRLGVSGNIGGTMTEDKNNFKQWWYNDGKPIKTDRNGWLDIYLTSSDQLNRKKPIRQVLWYARMVAPEVSEMYNASATPISLANWRVICNTGSLATEIGRIRRTSYYDRKLKRPIIDDNPVVAPGGHFYLVNDTGLFDYWYGNADGQWGSGPKEEIPVFQMDEERWGVSYKINNAVWNRATAKFEVTVDGSNWDKDMFDYETIVIIDENNKDDPESYHGLFMPVAWGNSKNMMEFWMPLGGAGNPKLPEKGGELMVLGLPYQGGIVSLTLKNEYEQICARTVDYGKFEKNADLGQSSEKIDPTKSTWVKRQKPTIGGHYENALNKAMQSRRNERFFIKNGPYCSVGESRNVSTGNDFERLGGSGDISKGANALSSISKHVSSSHIRLESCLGDVTRVGWDQAYDEVAGSSLSSVQAKNGGWKKDKWIGHTLRFLTGPLRGEKFPIISNSKKTILLAEKNSRYLPRSSPNRKSLKPNTGNKFSIGPGYATPMCYTRKSGESAVWTWENAIPYSGTYDLYIHGLNDAIDTTEFLEENNNASLDVEVWNYKTKEFNVLKQRRQYGKQDSFNAGKIKPENISGDGSIKIQLTAHDVIERNTGDKTGEAMVGSGGRQTGIAWFNYAVITPVPVPGRVNINTAPERLLSSLPGIDQKLAKNIVEGIDRNGKKDLKPYESLGDLFKVKGMTPDIFERCVNILGLDSSAFTIEVEAQILKPTTIEKSVKLNSDLIIATRKKRFVIETDKKADNYVDIIERERYPVR